MKVKIHFQSLVLTLISLALFTFVSFFVSGCVVESTSSGINSPAASIAFPEGVPRKVGVAIDGGDPRLASQASSEFTAGLFRLGFDVVERSEMDAILREFALKGSGMLDSAERVEIGKMTGTEGIFVGSVTYERSAAWVDSHVNVRLIDVNSGRVIWTAEAHDPRLVGISDAPETSIIHSTREALKLLKKDLRF